jgi:selenide,water dikinase
MNSNDNLVLKDLVLVGGGHAHVSVLKKFGMRPIPGVRLTLICRDLQAPYSGMLPGYIAGHYSFDEAHIDLGPLSRFAGARFFHDEVVGLDTLNKKLSCKNRPDVCYDLLSINIGSAPNTSIVPGASGQVIPVKPIDGFFANWHALCERVLEHRGSLRIGVVGAGAGGVELILAVQYRLEKLIAEDNRDDTGLEFHLFTDADEILLTHNSKVRSKFYRVLNERGIHTHLKHKVSTVHEGSLECANGQRFILNEILWVTMASAQDWLKEAGLEVNDQGFVKARDSLESISHTDIFVAGDVADVVNHPRPKSGVFAVRQGVPLANNLRRRLLGKPVKDFTPQKRFLSLISTGDKYAIASRSWWALDGKLVWKWKDWIDRKFMGKFNQLPEMPEEAKVNIHHGLANKDVIKEMSTIAMRCGGCGAKVGATVLENALAGLEPVSRDDVLIGLHEPDDAAVVSVPDGKLMVHTVDSFRSFIDDPYVFGQIAANHALSDLFAMGAEAQTALSIVTIPYGLENQVEETLRQMMQGAIKVLNKANTALVGGHTSEGEELSLGFAVNGFIDQDHILRKMGMNEDDLIVMTKAIGTGTLFAADMRHRAKGRWIAAAIKGMLQSNQEAAQCFFEHAATACTDVTGFGLLGHLTEMVKPSGLDVELNLAAIPCLQGAEELIAEGIFSSLQAQNLRLRRAVRNPELAAKNPRYPLIFDPQTSGGLVASVPRDRVDACVETLISLGYDQTSIIGRVLPRSEHMEPITLV